LQEKALLGLLGQLDERESKLRQHLSALAEQQSLWKRSTEELKIRESEVEEWNNAHGLKQQKLDEGNAALSRLKEDLDSRQIAVAENEGRLENLKKELADRDIALTAQISRVSEAEIACGSLPEKLLNESVR
jgi:hypothetical protein